MRNYIFHILTWGSVFGLCLSKDICSKGQYLDTKLNTCVTCSTRCPDNQVIRRGCQKDRDTECGPLFELSDFFQKLSRDPSGNENTFSLGNHVQKLETAMHEKDSLMFVLLLVLLLLTSLLVVLALVALVMYRKRHTDCVEINDPEKELRALVGGIRAKSNEYSIVTDKTVLVSSHPGPGE